ncbi:MAG: mechanosensitive ion channel family protein [Chloroflexota bacterium]
MPTTPVVTDWGTAIMTSVAAALALLLSGIPKIIGFVVILLIGWLIASAIATAIAAVLRAVKFNDLANRAGLTGFVQKMGIHNDAAGFLANVAKWFVRLIVLVTAFDALGLPAVSQVLQQLLLWLPNLVVALVVLVIGGLAAGALANLVRGATAASGLGDPDLLATVARVAVWAFAIVIAVNQIGVAATLVNTLFMAIVGALALALGLAFGLGGRETAAQIVRGWYDRGQQAAPKMAQATEAAKHQAQQPATPTSGPAANGARSITAQTFVAAPRQPRVTPQNRNRDD